MPSSGPAHAASKAAAMDPAALPAAAAKVRPAGRSGRWRASDNAGSARATARSKARRRIDSGCMIG